MCLTGAVEAGGISKGGLATAAEDIDGTMTDCGGGGAGAGWRMVETDGKGGAHVKNSKTMRLLLCVSNFVVSWLSGKASYLGKVCTQVGVPASAKYFVRSRISQAYQMNSPGYCI